MFQNLITTIFSPKGLWRENDKDIRQVKDELEKVKIIPMPQKKIERNYMAKQTIANARIWFKNKDNRQHKRQKIITVDRQNAVQTLQNGGT